MEKYTVKDINELKKELSLGRKIKITGRRIIKLPKIMLQKIKNWYKVKKEKLYTYVADEAEQERDRLNSKIDNKLENLNEKILKKQEIYDEYKNDEAFQKEGSLENDYLNALGDQIKSMDSKKAKLNNKSIKVSSKSFGLFKTSRLALNKLAKAKWNAIQDKINARKAAKEEKKAQKMAVQEAAELINRRQNVNDWFEKLQNEYFDFKNESDTVTAIEEEFANTHGGMTPEEYIKSLNQDEENTYNEENTHTEEETSSRTRH